MYEFMQTEHGWKVFWGPRPKAPAVKIAVLQGGEAGLAPRLVGDFGPARSLKAPAVSLRKDIPAGTAV